MQAEDSINDEHFEHIVINVDKGQEPLRVDKFLMSRLERVTRNKVQVGIRAGSVLVNDKQVKPNHKVKPNDVVRVIMPKHSESGDTVIPENIPIDIVYEDESLMVINKPSGMVVHPGFGNKTGTLVNALAYYLKNSDIPVLPGNSLDRPGLVHRLDKETSGLMVIAKTEYAMTHLAKQFYDHSIERTYHALVWGNFDEPKGTIETHIGRDMRNRTIMAVVEDEEEGKRAVTHYEVLDDMYYVSLIKCNLETGRTHQIRVHMKHLNHPVFSDTKYGGDRVVKGTVYTKYKRFVENCFKLCPRQLLHAKSLGFIHPETEEEMFFESHLPEDITAVINKWRGYFNSKT